MGNRRLFWRIVDKIESLINQGEFTAGSRLPPERELAEMFDVSRPTIREAIIALEVRGRVEVKTGSGVYVVEQKNASIKSKEISAFELTQARALIEGEIAALAAQSITEEELEQLNQTLIVMEKGLYDSDFIKRNLENSKRRVEFYQQQDFISNFLAAYKNAINLKTDSLFIYWPSPILPASSSNPVLRFLERTFWFPNL